MKVVTPEYNWDWPHLLLIFDKLEKVVSGEIKKLMIFMPPRHGKSECVTVRFPIWCMERNPKIRTIVGAYSTTLAEKFSRTARGIARERFPLSADRKAAEDWQTGDEGGMRAVGVGSGVTGYGGHLIIIDDPIKSREEADSPAYRERVWNWYMNDIYTRREPKAPVILINTRWHQDDLAGKILKSEDGPNWTVLSLPALAEEGDELGRAVGEPLCEDRFDLADLLDIKRVLGIAFYALYQQRPTPKEGDFFKREWFEIVPQVPADIRFMVRYWDRASTSSGGDYTAGVLMGYARGIFYVMDVVRGQWDSESRDILIRQTVALDEERYGRGAIQIWEEREGGSAGKDAGNAFVKMLAGHPAYTESVSGKGDKSLRAGPFQAQAMVRAVVVVQGSWNEAYLEELSGFPFGNNDDQVDGTSGAFRRLIVRQKIAENTEETQDEAPGTGRERYFNNTSRRGKL